MQHTIFKILSFLLLPVLMGAGCQKEYLEEDVLIPAEFYKFADFGCEHHIWHLKMGHTNNYYIINSQEELEKYITTDCLPQIDFSEYIIILGSKSFAAGASLLHEKVEANNEELVYTVTFLTDNSAVAAGAKYHIVVPMPYNKDIKVVEVIKDDNEHHR
ncbi:hypothetical protein [Saccharicrinis sp. GN24d3]|uniref:hypothetical protein n=1 Tax=Saccharicrinis sp. GN24d3 TaxID=3458416 RepID=UPI00403561A9